MDHIRSEIEEMILEFLTKSRPKPIICYPNDILEILSYDAVEDIKERIWEVLKYELDYHAIFEEYERKNYDDDDSDLEEDELQTDEDSDGEE